jgi:hypothetical protein
MKHIVSGLISLSLVGAVLLCLQVVLTQRSALALNLTDEPTIVTHTVFLSEPVTSTVYFTSYLPFISRPEAFVSGHISDNGTPVTNVTVSSSNGQSATTDINGAYQLHLPNGSYTLTPTLAGYTFSPTFRLATVPPDVTGLNFEATPPACTAGATVFFDDFSNANSGWGEQNVAAWYRHYTASEYEATLKVNTKLHHAAPGVANTSGNFVVSADIRQADAPDYGDGYGLWIGSPALGKYYEFAVSTNTMFASLGNYGVIYYDGTAPIWLGKASGTSNAVNMNNGVNALRVHRCGSRYYFFANNTLLTTLILSELANESLTAGYYARANQNATYRLDNFRIQTAP